MANKQIKTETKKPGEYADRESPVNVVAEPESMPYAKNMRTAIPAAFAFVPPSIYGKNSQDTMAKRTIGLMGMEGKRDFAHIHNENDFISVIRTGIPKQAMTHLMHIADFTLNEMASIIHTSDRTLRRYGPQQKLSQDQSERMVEMARLYSRGEEVFGSLEKFRQWMDTLLLPFGNKKPKEFLDTSLGIGMLMDELAE